MSKDPDLALAQHALTQGWLPREQLREALILREQLRSTGRAADLGQVLLAGYLGPEHARALLARRAGAPRAEASAPVAIAPAALARAAELGRRPAEADPPAVRELLAALAIFGAKDTVSLAPATDPGPPRPAPVALPTSLPRRLGPFELGRELGRGGMGAVFAAHHPGLDRPVAIKVVLGWDAGRHRRFQVEARTTARLRHPNIVGIHEVGIEQGHPYLVMDFIEGEPLSARLEREGVLEPRAAARLAATLARALDYAHRRGVLHRDLKPSNILLDAEGTPVITDFGLAKELASGESLTRTGQIVGTLAYMPPEQARGDKEKVDARSDVYALGATLYELLAGQPPFTGGSAMEVMVAVMHRPAEPPSRVRPREKGPLDPRLDALVLRCLQKDNAARPPSALALAEELEAWLGEGVVAAPAARAATPVAALAVAAAAVAAAGVLGGLLFAERRSAGARARARSAAAEVLERLGTGAPGAPLSDEQAAVLAQALALDPGLDDARAALAEAALARAEPGAARDLLDAAPRAEGEGRPSPRLRAARARVALAAGRHDEALALLEGTSAAAGPAARDLALALAGAADARGWAAAAEAARWDALRADPAGGAALAGIVRARLAALDAAGLARLWEGLHDRLGLPGEPTLLEAARADEAAVEAALRDGAAPPRLRLRAAVAAARHRRPAVVEALRAVLAGPGETPLLVEAARASLLVTGRLAPDGLPDAGAAGRDLARWAEAATPTTEAEGAAQALTLLERAGRLGAGDRGALLRLGREAKGALLREAVPLAIAIAGSRDGGLPPDAARGLLDGLAGVDAVGAVAARAALLALDGEAPAGPQAAPALRLATALLALPGPRRDLRDGGRLRAAIDAAARAAPRDAVLAALRLEDALARGDADAAKAAAGAAAGDARGAELGAQLAVLLDPAAAVVLPATLARGDPTARAEAEARVRFARTYAVPALPGADGAVRAVLVGTAPWAARAVRDGFVADQPGPPGRPMDGGKTGVVSLRTRWRCGAWHHLEVQGAHEPGQLWVTLDAADAREVETGVRAEWRLGGPLAAVVVDSYELARREQGRSLNGRELALTLERGAVVARDEGEVVVDAPLPARVARGGGRAYLDWTWGGGRVDRVVLEGRWAPDPAPVASPDLRARLAALVPVDGRTPTIERSMGDGNAMPDVAGLRRMGQFIDARLRWVGETQDACFVGVGGLRGDVEIRARLRFPAGPGQTAGLALRARVPRGDVVWLTFGDAPARSLCVNTQRETYWPRPIFAGPAEGDEVTLSLARIGDVVVARWAQGDGPLKDVGPGVFEVPFTGPVDAVLYAADWPQTEPFPKASFDRIEVLVPPP